MRMILVIPLLITLRLHAETPIAADTFVDSVGVNIHLSNTASIYYQQFPTVLQALKDLHIRHVRDGIVDYGSGSSFYYDNHNSLAKAGIRCDYIVGLGIAESAVAAYPTRVQDMESLEAVNEIDNGADPNWIADIQAQLKWLFPLTNSLNMPFVGPSFINLQWWTNSNSYSLVGNLSKYMNFNNLHNYLAGFSPETNGWGGCDGNGACYGSIAWNLDQALIDGPGTPVWTTETGYDLDQAHSNWVPAAVYGTYLPRLLLDQWNAGIKRTFIYELADDPITSPSLGLMDKQGFRQPAFMAVSSLLNLLQDPGPPFTPTVPLSYSISGNTSNVRHTLLQKRDGTTMLALWIAEPIYDPNAKTSLVVPPQTITLELPNGITSAKTYTYDSNWNLQPQTLTVVGNQVGVNVTSNVQLIVFGSAIPTVQSPVPVNRWLQIVSQNSSKCLSSGGNSGILSDGILGQWDCSSDVHEKFEINPVNGGYEITAAASGLQLNIAGGPAANQNGAQVIQSSFWGGSNQIWKVSPASSSYFTISPISSGKCLDITGVSKSNGAVAQQWSCWGGPNQLWRFIPVD